MPIQFQCVNCARTFRVRDALAGKTVKCPACETPLRVPAAGAAPPVGFALVEESAQEAPQPCSSCGNPMPLQDRICLACGFDRVAGKRLKHRRKSADDELEADLQDPYLAALLREAEEDADAPRTGRPTRRAAGASARGLKVVAVGLWLHGGATVFVLLALMALWSGVGCWLLTLFVRDREALQGWTQAAAGSFTAGFFLLMPAGLLNLPAPFLCLSVPDRSARLFLVLSLVVWIVALAGGAGLKWGADSPVSMLLMIALALVSSLMWLYFLRSLANYVGDDESEGEFRTLIVTVYIALAVVLFVGSMVAFGLTAKPGATPPADEGGIPDRSGFVCFALALFLIPIALLAVYLSVMGRGRNASWYDLTGIPWGFRYLKALWRLTAQVSAAA